MGEAPASIDVAVAAVAGEVGDVPAGYKRTKVGVIPEGWETKRLQELGYFLKGNGVRRDEANNGPLACVRYGEIYTRHNDHIREFHSWISSQVAARATRLQHGDLLFAGSGETKEEIGKCVAQIIDTEAYAGGDIVILRLTDANAHPHYLGYALNTPSVAQQKASFGQGDAVVHISGAALGQVKLPFPSVVEQRAIAEALSDVDSLLKSLDALIAKKRAIKQSVMQQLLTGKHRLTEFRSSRDEPSGYKRTVAGMIPADWEVASLRSCICADLDYGINAAAVPFDEKLPAYLRITDIGENNRYRPSTRVSVNHPNSESYVLAEGDIVFARTGASVGKSYLYNPIDGPLVFAGFLVRARPKPAKLDSTYCAYVVQSERYWKWVAATSSRSGQPGINGQEYGSFRFPLPKMGEQRAIATVLSDMDAGITALESHRDKTHAIRQGMMQQLLTGRVRLI